MSVFYNLSLTLCSESISSYYDWIKLQFFSAYLSKISTACKGIPVIFTYLQWTITGPGTNFFTSFFCLFFKENSHRCSLEKSVFSSWVSDTWVTSISWISSIIIYPQSTTYMQKGGLWPIDSWLTVSRSSLKLNWYFASQI